MGAAESETRRGPRETAEVGARGTPRPAALREEGSRGERAPPRAQGAGPQGGAPPLAALAGLQGAAQGALGPEELGVQHLLHRPAQHRLRSPGPENAVELRGGMDDPQLPAQAEQAASQSAEDGAGRVEEVAQIRGGAGFHGRRMRAGGKLHNTAPGGGGLPGRVVRENTDKHGLFTDSHGPSRTRKA